MSKIVYYLFLKPISMLPLWVLLRISDVLAPMIYYVVGYRKKVVLNNLRRSFPDRSEKEIKRLAFAFYRHFCDLVVEDLRLFSMPEAEIRRRFKISNPEVADRLFDEGRSVAVVTSHFNNWEMAAKGIDLPLKHQTVAIYTKLKDAFFNKKFKESRSRFGTHMISTTEVGTFFRAKRDTPTMTVFASDQSPTYNKGVVWTDFLNQDTAVANGLERFSKAYDLPVLYGCFHKVKRGYYNFELEVLFEHPKEVEKGVITKTFTKRLEQDILDKPQYWLWTHRRWKRNRNHEQAE